MMAVLPIFAAYGRTFKDENGARDSWQNGQDWKMYDGPYLSIRDSQKLLNEGFDCVDLHWHANGRPQCLLIQLHGTMQATRYNRNRKLLDDLLGSL